MSAAIHEERFCDYEGSGTFASMSSPFFVFSWAHSLNKYSTQKRKSAKLNKFRIEDKFKTILNKLSCLILRFWDFAFLR